MTMLGKTAWNKGKKNKSLSLSKENSPWWKGGITKSWIQWKNEHHKEFEIWREEIYKRDNRKCRVCGSTDGVQAHHILSVRSHRCFAFLVMNGVCLCRKCHKDTDNFGAKALKEELLNDSTRCVIQIIPHIFQFYETVGNYGIGTNGEILIFVSDLHDEKFNMLVAIHELVEVTLTQHDGVSEKSITEFDMKFEEKRNGNLDEPGDDPKAPYRDQHSLATSVERMLTGYMGLNWSDYEKACNSVEWNSCSYARKQREEKKDS